MEFHGKFTQYPLQMLEAHNDLLVHNGNMQIIVQCSVASAFPGNGMCLLPVIPRRYRPVPDIMSHSDSMTGAADVYVDFHT